MEKLVLTREEIRQTFAKVAADFRAGVFDDVPVGEYRNMQTTHDVEPKPNKLFAMQAIYEKYDCGTVACIGGWAAYELLVARGTPPDPDKDWVSMGLSITNFHESKSISEKESAGLYNMFFQWAPPGVDKSTISPTSAEAAACIDRWLADTYTFNPWHPDATKEEYPQ